MCKYILIYSTYLIICSSFFIILCTFIIIWGALNIICGSSNIIFGKYYNMLCAFQSIWCTYYHYDDDDRSNIMPCTSSVLFGSLCNPWWRTNNIICSTFFFMMMIFRKLLFGVLVKWVVKPGPGREARFSAITSKTNVNFNWNSHTLLSIPAYVLGNNFYVKYWIF